MSTTPNALAVIEGLSQSELLTRRKAILDRAQGKVSTLDDADLTELVAILNLLRKRSSAPPATRYTGPRTARSKPVAASDNELLNL